MALTTFPLDKTEYTADALGAWFASRTRGVLAEEGHYDITANGGMAVIVGTGIAWLRMTDHWGVVVRNEESIVLELQAAHNSLPRVDAVCLQLDKVANESRLVIKSGTAGVNPTPIPPVRDENMDEVYLALVTVPAGTIGVSAINISDKRLDAHYCGLVLDGERVPTQGMHDQFNDWFAQVQDTLSGDVAGNLIGLVSEATERAERAYDLASDAGVIHYTIALRAPVRISPQSLNGSRSGIAASGDRAGNVLFGGGGNPGTFNQVNLYEPNSVRITLPNLSTGRPYLAAAIAGDSVLFGGGSLADNVDRYTPERVRVALVALSNTHANTHAASISGSAIFATHTTTERYTPEFVRTSMSPLSSRSNDPGVAHVSNNAIFAGGHNNSVVDRYSPEFVRSTLTSLPWAGQFIGADGFESAVFAYQADAVRYDSSFVRRSITALSVSRLGLAGAGTGEDVCYGGGASNGAIVDRYNSAFARTTLPNLSQARRAIAAAGVGGSVWFGGGATGLSTRSNVMDRYNFRPPVEIPTLLGAHYKFEEHDVEQTAVSTPLLIPSPNRGYIRLSGNIRV